VNQNGLVYQKNIAAAPGEPLLITRFDPEHSWELVD